MGETTHATGNTAGSAGTAPGPAPHPREQLTGRAVIVWAAGVLVYIAAIAGRTSFGVAGVDAIDRFGINASQVATFTSVQVGVYALAQIPTGVLIDRFGPRKLLVAGALVMGLGQVALGFSTSYGTAIAARVLIGAGDATTFLSVLRIIPYWFPPKRTPIFTQLTTSLGQLGQFVSAVPFMALLSAQGWTIGFVSLGSVVIIIGIAASIAVKDSPEEDAADQAGAAGDADTIPLVEKLKYVLSSPVCWFGFFNHFVVMMPLVLFTLLWGVPLMTLGMGLDNSTASLVLVLNMAAMITVSLVAGFISARLAARRWVMALIAMIVLTGVWAIFFVSEEPRTLTAIILVAITVGAMTPFSNYGFDYIREYLPRSRTATGTGLGNMGGFVATMVAAQSIGVLMTHHSGGTGNYVWADFRFGWSAYFAVMIFGIIGFVVCRVLMVKNDAKWAARGASESTVRVIEDRPPR